MSSFQDLDETRSLQPWVKSPEEFRAVGVEVKKERAYSTSASGLLW